MKGMLFGNPTGGTPPTGWPVNDSISAGVARQAGENEVNLLSIVVCLAQMTVVMIFAGIPCALTATADARGGGNHRIGWTTDKSCPGAADDDQRAEAV